MFPVQFRALGTVDSFAADGANYGEANRNSDGSQTAT